MPVKECCRGNRVAILKTSGTAFSTNNTRSIKSSHPEKWSFPVRNKRLVRSVSWLALEKYYNNCKFFQKFILSAGRLPGVGNSRPIQTTYLQNTKERSCKVQQVLNSDRECVFSSFSPGIWIQVSDVVEYYISRVRTETNFLEYSRIAHA